MTMIQLKTMLTHLNQINKRNIKNFDVIYLIIVSLKNIHIKFQENIEVYPIFPSLQLAFR